MSIAPPRRTALPLVFALASAACHGEPPPRASNPAPTPSEVPAPRPAPSAAAEEVTIRRTVVVHGRPAGSTITVLHADGLRESTKEVLADRGGPQTATRVKLGPDRTPVLYDAAGRDADQQPTEEHFLIDGGRATWVSPDDSGEKPLAGPAFYVPQADDADSFALLVEALVAGGGRGPLALLPDGEARAQKIGETTLTGPNGESKHLTAWAIFGLDFLPQIAWVDDAGAFWGHVEDWGGVVPEGWEKTVDRLRVLVKGLRSTRTESEAHALGHPAPAAGLAFTHARVLDVLKGAWLEDQTVLVAEGKIRALGPTKTTRVPPKAGTIDAGGKALLPGLWDMHAHLDESSGPLYVGGGVTTVRDLGNHPDLLDDLKRRYDGGTAIGPHVLKAGFLDGRGEGAAPTAVTAQTPDEAKKAVDLYAKRGYVGINVHTSIPPEVVPVIAKEAHARGLRVSGEVPVKMRADDAVRAGLDELHGINLLFLPFVAPRDADTRTAVRFVLVAEKAAALDLSSKPVADLLALLRDKKTVIDPTLDLFENLFVARPGEIGPSWKAVASRVPGPVERSFRFGGLPVPEGMDATYKGAFAASLKMTKALYDEKVPLVAGTDSIGGLVLPRELELLVEAGVPPVDAVRAATIGAARVMKMDKTSGSVTVGKDA
ncbi:MAG TPA: amidohydrolase family protein, partial [Polyangiaceae bacterium]